MGFLISSLAKFGLNFTVNKIVVILFGNFHNVPAAVLYNQNIQKKDEINISISFQLIITKYFIIKQMLLILRLDVMLLYQILVYYNLRLNNKYLNLILVVIMTVNF